MPPETKKYTIMSAAQAIASRRFLRAMGPMIEDEKKMMEVLNYIESIKVRPVYQQISMSQLEENAMLLHQAMDQLREKARAYYQA